MNSQAFTSLTFRAFEEKNIPLLVERLRPLWGVQGRREELDLVTVEYIVRHNIYKNDFALEAVCDGEFLAATFVWTGSEKNDADEWFCKKLGALNCSKEELYWAEMSKTYIAKMDAGTRALMEKDSIQMTLFASMKSGAGTPLLNELCERLKQAGHSALYLWTDQDCSWQYYPRRGFETLREGVFEPFSESAENPYRTFIYKRELRSV